MIKYVQLFLLSLTVLYSNGCSPAQDVPAGTDVVLIFKDAPGQSSTGKTGGRLSTSSETISFVDEDGECVSYTPELTGSDTLIIPTKYGYGEIRHQYQVLEDIYYLFPAGDTVVFTYSEDKRPYAESRLSDRYTRLYNLPYRIAYALHPNGYANKTIINDFYFRTLYERIFSPDRIPNERMENKYKHIAVDLDSLQRICDRYDSALNDKIDSLRSAGGDGAVYADYFAQRFLKGYPIEAAVQSDSLMQYVFYQLLAQDYPKGDNPVERFDNIVNDPSVCPVAKRMMLKKSLNEIFEGGGRRPFSEELKREYIDRYITATQDTNGAIGRVSHKKSDKSSQYDLALEDMTGNQAALQDIIADHAGKVIYIDLWASWCAPCRYEQPFSEKLQQVYLDKPVVFLNLSLDQDASAWKNAVKSLAHGENEAHYRVLREGSNRFLREINNRTIPRYLLIGKDGGMVDTDAPRPSNYDAITQSIDACL